MELKPKRNKLFGAEMERDGKMRHMGPTSFIYIYIYSKGGTFFFSVGRTYLLLFLLFSLSSLFDIWKSYRRNSSGQERKVFNSTRATRQNKKTWDFTEFSIKNSENPMFWFFLGLRLSDGQNWSD